MLSEKMKVGICILVHTLLCFVSILANEEPLFRVRRRMFDADARELNQDDLFLTYSEEGRSKALDDFILVMFQTPSEIQDDAIPVLRMAMNKFLLAEMDAIYSPQGYPLESIGSEVLAYKSTTKAAGRRSLQEIGTQAEMEVTVKFKSEPSPQRVLLEDSIREVMSNLQYFVTNLTSFQHSDWKDVTEAYRLEMGTDPPTASPAGNTDSIQQPDDNTNNGGDGDKNNFVGAVVPTTLVGATLIAIVAFLFVQRRSRNNPESPKGGNAMFVGVDNDLYSMDKSLESSQSPLGLISPMGASNDYGSSVDGSVPEDSVYSGLEDTPSNHNNVKGTKSMLSGITHGSSSTIRASNMEQQRQRMQSLAAAGSLFAFEEEVAHDDDLLRYDSGDDLHKANRTDADQTMQRHQQDSTSSQQFVRSGTNEQTKPVSLASYGSQSTIEPGSSSHVLMDLEKFANSRAPSPRPDPTPTSAQQTTESVSYSIFNCNPILPKENQTLYSTKYELDGSDNIASASTRGHVATPMNRAYLNCAPQAGASTTKTPLVRNTETSITTRRSASSSQSPNSRTLKAQRSSRSHRENSSNAVGMSGKQTRVVGGVYNADGSLISDRLAMSVDDTALLRGQPYNPPTSGSKSAPSSPEKNRIRGNAFAKIRSMQMHDFDYIDNLSRPSTPGVDPDSPRLGDYDNAGYGCYPFHGLSSQAPSAPGEDPPGNGRRHVGNTGIDGTAMYQTNAMHPLDWSYKSADMQSVGDSVLSENDGAAMPTQFLFGGSKRGERTIGSKSPERFRKSPKAARTPSSQKSGKSDHTNDSSNVSASRQLINDLVWLERKIADVRQGSTQGPPGITAVDSLSYVSDDNVENLSASSRDESEGDPTVSTGKNGSVMSSIVCRDCYAPPGKLHIVIHSTKDGPAVHTVKQGSSLEGHIFPGDLIISVDNVDTRSFTAEQVMKMMAAKSNKERKITVLHFEEED